MLNNISEQEGVRINKKKKLEELGIDIYPSNTFNINSVTINILKNFKFFNIKSYNNISIAGRLINKRVMGSSLFCNLQDSFGKIQLYVNKKRLIDSESKISYKIFTKLIDIGDIVGVKGFVFITQSKEISIYVKKINILSKSLKPLPMIKEFFFNNKKKIYGSFSNIEDRYRQRYLDLILNNNVRDKFLKRSKIFISIRDYLNKKNYLEVETPILQNIYGGASARPFKTYHNALNIPLYLRISNELYLKRLIIGGYHGVYEFAKDFRNEGMSRFHNPEFTQLEWYVAYKDYLWMMNKVEEMLEKICLDLHGTTKIIVGNNIINFQRPWARISLFDAIKNNINVDIENMSKDELCEVAKKNNINPNKLTNKNKIIDEIFGEKCEKKIIQPTFITGYPVEMSPLAKRYIGNLNFVERFEVICNGKEICNAFSELNDPVDQKKRFQEQFNLLKKGDSEAMMLDKDFLKSLSYGMPPTVGIGIGIDRLSMIMTNSKSIQDVIFFPQMKTK